MKKLLAIVTSALTLGAFATAADPVITADTSAVPSGTTCTVMAGDEEAFDFVTNGGDMTIELDEVYVGRRVCLAVGGEEITESTTANMGAANESLRALPKFALAIEPVAVWEGGFSTAKGDYTIAAPENSTTTIGDTIVIGDAGVKIGNFPTETSGFTVIVKYSNLKLDATGKQTMFVGTNTANANNVGVFMQANNGGLKGIARNAEYQTPTTTKLPESGVVAFETKTGSGTSLLLQGATSVMYNNTGLTYNGNNYDSVTLFGEAPVETPVSGVATGVVIEKIAVFTTKLSQEQVNDYVFPSEDTTEVFDGTLPSNDDIARFQAETWTGTVWIKNRTNWNGFNLNSYGNANSTVRLTGIVGYNAQGSHVTPTVELVDETDANGNVTKKALEIRNGWTGNLVIIDKLIGSGTLDIAAGPVKTLIKDSSAFKGMAKVTIDGEAGLIFGNVDPVPVSKGCVYDKKITIVGETPVEIHNAWTAPQGIVVNGTLNVPSTIAKQSLVCDLLVSEDGTVNVAQTDWIPYDAAEDKVINVKGTLDFGTTRQTLKEHNKINIYPGATITGTATGVDGGCHINTLNGNCVISMLADGEKTEAATISAIIGPQGQAATLDVADGLTLNLAAPASSTGAGRTKGLVKTGTGTLNITGKYNTLEGITLNGGTIIVAEGATIPASGIVTTVEGKEVSCTDGVYTLVDEPTGPQTIEEITTDNVMDVVPEAIQAADATKLVAWITGTSGITTVEGLSSINVDCFLMGVANAEEAPELKITADDLAKILAAESLEAAAAALKDTYPNATVTVKDVTTKICGEGATNTHLYQLELSLPTAQD